MALVEIRNVDKSFKREAQTVDVYHDLTIDFEEGSFTALMGPSGSGKSTLLNLVAGLDKPTRGTVRVAGAEVSAMTASQLADWRARTIGFVFQSYNLLPVLTAQQNVELPLLLTNLGKKDRAERTAIALGVVGLGDRMDHYPRQLSGGQEQRVAIARALVTDPSLIVADEPTGNLDSASANEVLNILQSLCRDAGKTVIMVTHDPKAAAFGTRSVHLEKGELVA